MVNLVENDFEVDPVNNGEVLVGIVVFYLNRLSKGFRRKIIVLNYIKVFRLKVGVENVMFVIFLVNSITSHSSINMILVFKINILVNEVVIFSGCIWMIVRIWKVVISNWGSWSTVYLRNFGVVINVTMLIQIGFLNFFESFSVKEEHLISTVV